MTMNISLQIDPGSAAVITDYGDYKDVLNVIKYRVCGFDGFSFAYRNGEVTLSMPDDQENFFPYSQLTEDLVTSWIEEQDADNLQIYQQEIIQELEDKAANPSVVGMPLPWESGQGG